MFIGKPCLVPWMGPNCVWIQLEVWKELSLELVYRLEFYKFYLVEEIITQLWTLLNLVKHFSMFEFKRLNENLLLAWYCEDVLWSQKKLLQGNIEQIYQGFNLKFCLFLKLISKNF